MPPTTQPLGFTESDFVFEVLRAPLAGQPHKLAGLIERAAAGSVVADARELLKAALEQEEKLEGATLDNSVQEMLTAAKATSPSLAMADRLLKQSTDFRDGVTETEKWQGARAFFHMIRGLLIQNFRGDIDHELLEGE